MTSQIEKMARFRALHEAEGIFAIPNPWTAGTAKRLEGMGFPALATTSAGLGFDLGLGSSNGDLDRHLVLENAATIVAATSLPVNADLENGFGDNSDDCADTIRAAYTCGLAGGSIEDATGNSQNPIYEFDLSVQRVAAAVEAKPHPDFLITARAENFLWGKRSLDDTIARLKAFEAVGADVLYAPGLPDIEVIAEVCRSVDRPVNVVMGLIGPRYSLSELQAVGVKRVSVGGALARYAMAAFMEAAHEIRDHGTFGFSARAIPDSSA